MTASPATKVLLIAGSGRSGSTVLTNILGAVDGAFAGGEIRYLWQRGLVEGRLCGCGEHVHDCPVWSGVLARTSGDVTLVGARRLAHAARNTTRIRSLPGLVADPQRMLRRAPGYASTLERLYPAIEAVTGASLIVDSSKLPAYGQVLAAVPTVDLHVVHLVRDPRAAAYSWMRAKPLADAAARATMHQQSPLKSSALWTLWNLTADRLWSSQPDRYLRVRYEDFVDEPRATVERILRFAGHPVAASPFVDERTVVLGVNHTVAGNPDRLRTGPTTVRYDGEWQRSMRRIDRALVTAATGPMLWRYGYPLLAHPAFPRAPFAKAS